MRLFITQGEDNLFQLGMDSLKFINMIVAIEEKFGIEIPDEYLFGTEMGTIELRYGYV